jgi:hypothetical protein
MGEPMAGQALERGLVTCGDQTIRTGMKIVGMNCRDHLRIVTQKASRPKRIIKIAPPALKLRAKRPVNDQIFLLFEIRADNIGHNSPSLLPFSFLNLHLKIMKSREKFEKYKFNNLDFFDSDPNL